MSRFAAIWPRHWAKQMTGVNLDAVRDEWAAGLAGLTGEQIKAGIDHCRIDCLYPPSIAEFRKACMGGDTTEQRAFQARAAQEQPALPARTWAESKADGQRLLDEARRVQNAQRNITRTDGNIAAGLWTPAMDEPFKRDCMFLGIPYQEPKWPV